MTIGANQIISRARTLLSCCATLTDLEIAELGEAIRTVTDYRCLKDATLSVSCFELIPPVQMKGRFVYDDFRQAFAFSDGVTWCTTIDSKYTPCNIIYGVGINSLGLVGDGTTTCRSSWVRESGSSTCWIDLTGQRCTASAIKSDGTLWGWGYNTFGNIGDGTAANKSSPVQEASLSTNWCCVRAGHDHAHAIKRDGSMWGWGLNSSGQLGNNDALNKSSPVREASSSTTWCHIGVNGNSYGTNAIKTDGTLWSWGRNDYGQLGDNSATARSSPVQEASLSTNWCFSAIGFAGGMGIKTDGSLWTWGSRCRGMQGRNNAATPACDTSPAREATSSNNWRIGAVGRTFNMAAIKTDGTLWAWGQNTTGGVLGIGTFEQLCPQVPIQEKTYSSGWNCVLFTNSSTVPSMLGLKNGCLFGAGNLMTAFYGVPGSLCTNCNPVMTPEDYKIGKISKLAPALQTYLVLSCCSTGFNTCCFG